MRELIEASWRNLSGDPRFNAALPFEARAFAIAEPQATRRL